MKTDQNFPYYGIALQFTEETLLRADSPQFTEQVFNVFSGCKLKSIQITDILHGQIRDLTVGGFRGCPNCYVFQPEPLHTMRRQYFDVYPIPTIPVIICANVNLHRRFPIDLGGYLSRYIQPVEMLGMTPIVICVINDDGADQLNFFNHPEWWINKPVTDTAFAEYVEYTQDAALPRETLIVQAQNRRESLRYIEISVDEIDTLPERLIQVVGNLQQSSRKKLNVGSLQLSTHHNAIVSIEHLGAGSEASVGFIHDCLPQLLMTKIPFRIWIDARHNMPSKWAFKRGETQDLTFKNYHIFYANYWRDFPLILASPYLDANYDKAFPAHYCYIEYNGMVHDNYHAFAEPIPIAEYQRNIKSSWRGSLSVTPDMTPDTVETAFDDLIQRSRQLEE